MVLFRYHMRMELCVSVSPRSVLLSAQYLWGSLLEPVARV